jgi:hypothetical protein
MATKTARKTVLNNILPAPKKVKMPDVDHVIIDGDSAVYAVAWGPKSQKEMERIYDQGIIAIMDTLEAPSATVYVKGSNNFRYAVTPAYKTGRVQREMDPAYQRRIDSLYEYVQDQYACADGAEADDYCAVHVGELQNEGKIVVLSHIDKDLNTIPGYHWHPKQAKLRQYRPDMCYNLLMRQILMGDAGDSIQGIPGIGPKKSCEALHHQQPQEFWSTVVGTYKKMLGKDWKKVLVETANLVYLRQNYEDFRPLSWEELEDRLKWKGPLDCPHFLAQMDYEAMSMELDHGLAATQWEKRLWGALPTLDTGSGTRVSRAKKQLASTLNILGASSTK